MAIYIYIVIRRQTVLLYHNSSVWLNPRDDSSRDHNPSDVKSIGYLTPQGNVNLSVSEGIFLRIYLFTYTLLAIGMPNSWEELLHFSVRRQIPPLESSTYGESTLEWKLLSKN